MTTREEFEAWLITRQDYGYDLALAGWEEARKRALEEAAKECDLMAKSYDAGFELARADAAEQCAMGIRALKD